MGDQVLETAKKIFDGMAIAAALSGVVDQAEQAMKDPNVRALLDKLTRSARRHGAPAWGQLLEQLPKFIEAAVEVKQEVTAKPGNQA